MKVLVTGANGFLAINIIHELLRRNVEVTGLVRKTADTRLLHDLDIEILYGEITDAADVRAAVKGRDRVIHVAANTSQRSGNYRDFEMVNVVATRHVLEACANYSTGRLIYVGTANAFGYGTRLLPGNENIPANPAFMHSNYARSKYEAQQLVLKYVAEKRLDCVVINPTFMLGPFDARPGSGRIILMYYGKKHVFVPPGGKNFVHVRDVAEAVCNAMLHGRKGQCYITGGENLSYDVFYQLLGEVSGHSFHIHRIPAPVMMFAGYGGSALALAGIPTEMNRINTRLLCIGNYYDSSKAISELMMPQSAVSQAIQDALEWYVRQGMVRR